jgi:hypothetical protein
MQGKLLPTFGWEAAISAGDNLVMLTSLNSLGYSCKDIFRVNAGKRPLLSRLRNPSSHFWRIESMMFRASRLLLIYSLKSLVAIS